MIIEVALDSVEGALVAQSEGASRIELCANLNEGGTTPSFGLISSITQSVSIPVFTMVRPRAGDFVYSDFEFKVMKADIAAAAKAGSKGVVFGVLNPFGWIDLSRNYELVQTAKKYGLQTTFHRAFDVCNDPFAALQALCEMQFDNLLTSGNQPTADLGIAQICNLIEAANGRISLIAGSGINSENALRIARCGVNAIHFTARKKVLSNTNFSFGETWNIDEEKIRKIVGVLR